MIISRLSFELLLESLVLLVLLLLTVLVVVLSELKLPLFRFDATDVPKITVGVLVVFLPKVNFSLRLFIIFFSLFLLLFFFPDWLLSSFRFSIERVRVDMDALSVSSSTVSSSIVGVLSASNRF